MDKHCYCGSEKSYEDCCQIIHLNPKSAVSAEQLMRARYSAFCIHQIDFLYNSFHPSTRRFQRKSEIEQWANENQWNGLEIVKSTENTVEFKASFRDANGRNQIHHEKSKFQKLQGIWYYLDGKTTTSLIY